MTNSAQKHFNFALCLLILTFILPAGKIFLQRRQRLERSRAAVISDVFFCTAAAISMANLTGLVVKSMEEIKLRQTTDDELIIGMTMLAPKWLKVDTMNTPLLSSDSLTIYSCYTFWLSSTPPSSGS